MVVGATEARRGYDAFYRRSLEDPDGFWMEAAEMIGWTQPPERAFEQAEAQTFRWFPGGRTNLAFNALDRHVAGGRGGHLAIIALDERGNRGTRTYAQLLQSVSEAAAALRAIGVGRGDRVTIYMPTCLEAIIAMLAIVRIGAIHSVVFAGFGAGALRDRIEASGSRVVITADLTYRKGKEIDLLSIVGAALDEGAGGVEHLVVLERGERLSPASGGRASPQTIGWNDFTAKGAGGDGSLADTSADDPAFILATSGTTARPKLAVHRHGGYQVHISAMGRWVFDLRADDVWWSSSDIGWVVGHGYIVYAPLIAGCTTIAYEGALDEPDADQPWRIIEAERVTGVFTSPTAVRLLMRYGEEVPRRHDLASVRRIVCAGEVLNAPAWEWLQQRVFDDRVPVIDHMWQTETGGPIFGNPYGLDMLPIKPGSAGLPLPGIEAVVVDAAGAPVATGEKGIMLIRRPFPGLISTLWGDPDRYRADYWDRIPGGYYVGDAAHVDEDGYVWFAGRADEIIKTAGHRLGTIEVETAFLRHPAVAEAGVTGIPDELRGEVIAAFVALRGGHEPSEELKRQLLATVRGELGPVAVIGSCSFVATLPKTRSGKIMRRVLKAVALHRDPGDISTIEDEGSVEEARQAVADVRASVVPGQVSAGRTVDAVFFDLFGTLVDLEPLAAACEAAARSRGTELAAAWRARQLEISWLRTAMSAFVDFDQVTSDALDAALDELDLGLAPPARQALGLAFEELPLHANAPASLDALRALGLRTGVLTNAARGTLQRVLARIRLNGAVDHALSADAVRRFKPDPAVYRLAAEATGLEAERIGFVTSNGWDAAGAGAFGFRVAWLQPTSRARLPRVGAPQPTVATWQSVVDLFRV
ncbi:MAG: haloacid dehalogenase type II [Candidatus Limnocylindria bacterium]